MKASGREIQFNRKAGGFSTILKTLLKSHVNELVTGELIEVALDDESLAYSGSIIVSLDPGNTNFFITNKIFTDPSRFPARIKAAATALRDMGFSGHFHISHQEGNVSIQRLFDWSHLQKHFFAEQTYLARKDGKIVCCTLQPDDNPGAPDVILVGDKPRNMEVAGVLHGQKESFPVFLKEDVNRWRYVGRYKWVSDTTESDELAKAIELANRAVTRIIFLQRTDANVTEDASLVVLDPNFDVVSVIEGGKRLVAHLRRERSRSIIEEKKRKVLRESGTLFCECCGFDFVQKYGTLGIGFCEVHHVTPLSSSLEETNTTLADLAVVCANCHRMLHRGPQFLEVAALRNLIKTHGSHF